MAERAAVRRAMETLEIQQPEQLGNLDKHCRSILKHSHPDKVEEAKRTEHTERTQSILAARALVKENLCLATEILQSEEAQAPTAKARTPRVRRNSPFIPHPRAPPESFRTLPTGWESWQDEETDRIFYWNPETRQSQWNWPVSRITVFLEAGSNYDRCPRAGMPKEQAQQHRALPPSWERWWAKKEAMFFFHHVDTGRTQWLYPEGVHA